jgi:hypothetical protein
MSRQYNTDKRRIIVGFSHYMIKNKPEIIDSNMLNVVETVVHTLDTDIKHLLSYFFHNIREQLEKKYKIENI